MNRIDEIITGVAHLYPNGYVCALPRPSRHHHIFALVAFMGLDLENPVQGFMTNHGRFVNRQEAAMIARDQKQVVEFIGSSLYSEDLW